MDHLNKTEKTLLQDIKEKEHKTDGEVVEPETEGNEVALFGNNVYVGWNTFTTDSARDVFFLSGTLSPQPPSDSSPPTITINSAVDRYNIPITNQIGTTVSNTITFDFSVTDDVSIASIACYLDGNPAACESSPVTYTEQSAGQHTFRINATDTSNPSSAQFIWTVLTAGQGIEQLTQTVDSMGLPQGVANNLKGPLYQASNLLTDELNKTFFLNSKPMAEVPIKVAVQ